MKTQRESVLHAFMRRLSKKTQCVKCHKPMITLDEPTFYADRVCSQCEKELLKMMLDHAK